jgi:hypothetical protein
MKKNESSAKPKAKRTAARGGGKPTNKTAPTRVDVNAYIDSIASEPRRRDAKALLTLMKKVTGERPTMWGPSMIGFGQYHYRYESGREGDMFKVGFAARATGLVVYLISNASPEMDALFSQLGKYSTGKSCLYIKKLDDVNVSVLERLIAKSYETMNSQYPD